MTLARRYTVGEEEAVYHCISRCVRRAYLHGYDSYTGKNYDYRKDWIRDRLIFLGQIFTIDTLAYGLVDNHGHSLLRTRPDLLAELTDEQVARRWLRLYPKGTVNGKVDEELLKAHVSALCEDEAKIKILRRRLCNVSWFMKSLNEYIARRANKEDKVKGRFWEGRFKCVRLEDEPAILSCAVYIDLNPIRAGKAPTPETSEYTSAFERIRALTSRAKQGEEHLWLAPIANTGPRRGFLPMSLPEYLSILDATGREIKNGKRGRIAPELEQILVRIGARPDHWVETALSAGKRFAYVAGTSTSLAKAATAAGKKWIKGSAFARSAFF